MLLLDFEKAYDRIEWKFITMMLEAFGFPRYFCIIVQVLLKDASSQFEVNGALSTPFPLGHSIRQGCQLTGALFVIGSESLFYILSHEPKLKGYMNIQIKYYTMIMDTPYPQFFSSLWLKPLARPFHINISSVIGMVHLFGVQILL